MLTAQTKELWNQSRIRSTTRYCVKLLTVLTPERVKSQVCLFADDCLLYRVIKMIEDQLLLQEDLKALEEWASTWGSTPQSVMT